MNREEFIRLMESAAKARGGGPVPRACIVEALRRIETGQEDVDRYPTGFPSFLGVHEIAVRIEGERAVKN